MNVRKKDVTYLGMKQSCLAREIRRTYDHTKGLLICHIMGFNPDIRRDVAQFL
jgi:hypothetical protein